LANATAGAKSSKVTPPRTNMPMFSPVAKSRAGARITYIARQSPILETPFSRRESPARTANSYCGVFRQLVSAMPTSPAHAAAPGCARGTGSDGDVTGTGVGGAMIGDKGSGSGEGCAGRGCAGEVMGTGAGGATIGGEGSGNGEGCAGRGCVGCTGLGTALTAPTPAGVIGAGCTAGGAAIAAALMQSAARLAERIVRTSVCMIGSLWKQGRNAIDILAWYTPCPS
jgi:hypothetical protein